MIHLKRLKTKESFKEANDVRDLTEKTLETNVLFNGRVIDLEVQKVELPNGKTSTREIVNHPGAVAILPIQANGHLLLVRQFRKPLEKVIYEIPAGKLEKGEDPESCAYRELEEETGFKTEQLTQIASFYTSPGFANEKIVLYYTDQLVKGNEQLDEDEFLDLVEVSLEEAKDMVADGRIDDAKTVYAVQYLELKALKK